MSIYSIDSRRVSIDVNIINGYLSAIALMRDYTTPHLGFYYCFKKLNDNKYLTLSLIEEIRGCFVRARKENSEIYVSDDQVEELIKSGITLTEIDNWETKVVEMIDYWTGTQLTAAIKDESRTWDDKPNLFSLNLIEILKTFFRNKEIKAYTFDGEIKKELWIYWGGTGYLDILFSNQDENYLLHFDQCD